MSSSCRFFPGFGCVDLQFELFDISLFSFYHSAARKVTGIWLAGVPDTILEGVSRLAGNSLSVCKLLSGLSPFSTTVILNRRNLNQ